MRRAGCFHMLQKVPPQNQYFNIRVFNNYSWSPNGLWVNSLWGWRPTGLLTQRPFGLLEWLLISTIQLVCEKYRDKTTWVSETRSSRDCFRIQSWSFSLYQRTITYNISPSSSSTNQNAGSGERRKWGSWLWHRCCDFPRITTGALSSNENGGKVIMRGVCQAETVMWENLCGVI